MAGDAEPIYGDLPTSWTLVTIGSLVERGVADIQTGPFGTMLHASEYEATGTPVVAVKNIGNNRLSAYDIPRVSESVVTRLDRYKLCTGDILFGRKGAIERRAIVRLQEEGWLQGSDCIRLRLAEMEVVPQFVSYVLGTAAYRHWVERNAQGATMPSLNQEIIGRIPLPLPSLGEQRAIAHILGTLDDKVELNRRMNETLEAMARALFKSWFVDFDPVRAKSEGRVTGLPSHVADLFPDRFEASELGEVPAGWAIKTMGDVAERVRMGPFGSSIKVDTFVNEGMPIISGQHLNGFMLEDNTFNYITDEHAEKLTNAHVQRGDVVFTHAGNIGQVAFIPEGSRYDRYVISQRQFFMRCDLSQVKVDPISWTELRQC